MNTNKYFLDFGAHLLQGFNQFLDLKIIDREFHCISFEANPYIFAKCLSTNLSESRKRVASLYLVNGAISGSSSPSNFQRLINLNSCRVENHIYHDNKPERFNLKIRNVLRRFRRYASEWYYGKEKIDQKKLVENTVATMASNILTEPPGYDSGHTFSYETEKVCAISIIEILKCLESPAEIVVKMDIEGAEFQALQDLLKNISELPFQLSILKIYIEWHERFFSDTKKYCELRKTIETNLKKLNICAFEWV